MAARPLISTFSLEKPLQRFRRGGVADDFSRDAHRPGFNRQSSRAAAGKAGKRDDFALANRKAHVRKPLAGEVLQFDQRFTERTLFVIVLIQLLLADHVGCNLMRRGLADVAVGDEQPVS